VPSNAQDTVDFVSSVFQWIDTLPRLSLRPETKAKLKKVREDTDKQIKEDSEREKREEVS